MDFAKPIPILVPSVLPSKLWLESLVSVGASKSAFSSPKTNSVWEMREVRSWMGWHRHTTLVLAAQAFLSVLRYQVEPLPELSVSPFFLTPVAAGSLAVFRAARGLSSD